MSLKSLIRGIGVALALWLAGTGVAAAAPVTWTLTGVTFSDGGTATGTFVYDADTNTYSSINIVTTAGGTLPGAAYTQVGGVYGGASLSPTSTRVGVLTAAGAGVGQVNLDVIFSSALTNAGGVVTITPGAASSAEVTCANALCSSPNSPFRGVSAGTVVGAPAPTIPTMSEWAMILFGLLLAGGAAVYIQRRRLTA